jgi:hypothetical protein
MNKLTYTPELVGIHLDNAFLSDYVMCGMTFETTTQISVPVIQNNRLIGSRKITATIPKDFGAESLFDEDILIGTELLSGTDFIAKPHNGGYDINFGKYRYFVRKAKLKEFSSINAFVTKEGTEIFNHTFIEKLYYKDFLSQNTVSQWRMPFSPESSSNFAISWQMIDSTGGKWECVAPNLQKPNYIPRLKHFALTAPEAEKVNIVYGQFPGYDVATHTFTVQPGCKMRLFFINSPMGQKEWTNEVELDLDTNTIKFI